MTRASKIPPHIARELARHVKSKSAKNPSTTTSRINTSKGNQSSKFRTFVGCVTFVGVTASFPFLAMKWIGPLNEKDEALTPGQIRRGAFNNSGTRDVGKDPMWNFKTGTRKKDKDYNDLFLKDNPNEIDHGDQFVQSSKRRR